MKTICFLLTAAFLSGTLHAEFRTWTRSDGKSASLELVSTAGEGDDLTGTFRMRNGRTVDVSAADLSDTDAELLRNWKSPEEIAAENASVPSVFDDILEGNLVKLNGKSLKRYEPESTPTEYYVFYYTASWCPPCQAYTPDLVKFYERTKTDNDKFELVLISSDRDEDAMEGYAKSKKMPWPQLKMSDVKKFRSKFDHDVTGIPSVVVCDLEGNIVAKTRDFGELKKLLN
ncbi:MAG: thioredoxin-like domain-containing protein [Luteolibacter sp.]